MRNVKKRKRGKSFTADRQPPPESKRVKKKKTLLREKVGLDSWGSIETYLLGKGAKKFIKEIDTLEGREFIASYSDAMEFFKPKLSRSEHVGDKGGPIKHEVVDYSKLTDEQLALIAALPVTGENRTEPA